MQRITNKFLRNFSFGFLFALTVSLLVQFLILPKFLPGLHAGDGLIVGTDSVDTHKMAIKQVEAIRSSEWREWRGIYRGIPMVGITSFVYHYLGPHPWLLIPLQAALHALAFATLGAFVSIFIPLKFTTVAALPLLFSLSAVVWYSQLLKDGFFVAGIIVLCYGVCSYLKEKNESTGASIFLIGAMLVWAARPYLIPFLVLAGIVGFLPAFLKKQNFGRVIGILLAVSVITVLPYRTDVASPLPRRVGERLYRPASEVYTWKTSSWMPSAVDAQFHQIAMMRTGFIVEARGAATSLDTDIEFKSAADVLRYLPRATWIALFAPFPSDWFSNAASHSSKLGRLASSLEMLLYYCSIPFLILLIYENRKNWALCWIVLFCLGMSIFQSLIVVNVGTLYRFRFPFLFILMSLGLAQFIKLVIKPGNKRAV